jgi:hypothetical protein
MIGDGKVFTWCREAAVYELVTPARCGRGYQVKQALLRGSNSLKIKDRRIRNILKSLIAVPIYSIVLPPLFLVSDPYFMKCLIKFCDHLGRILKIFGANPVKKRGTG